MKCKDIEDDVYLAAVATTQSRYPGSVWRHRHDVQATLETMLGHPVPEKLFLAKARKLQIRKKLEGCCCGCRGDFHLPEEIKK